jgi:hypothetical protein
MWRNEKWNNQNKAFIIAMIALKCKVRWLDLDEEKIQFSSILLLLCDDNLAEKAALY